MLKYIYFPNSSFLEAKKGSRPLRMWSSLLEGRDLLLKGCRWQVHSESNIDIWKDPWDPSISGFKIHSLKPPWTNSQLVSDLMIGNGLGWNSDLLKVLFSPAEVEAILNIPTSSTLANDRLVWHHNSSDVYSVRSGYWFLSSSADEASVFSTSSSFWLPGPKFGALVDL